MNRKKVSLAAKPRPTAATAATADDWVQSRRVEAGNGEAMKRLTVDVPSSLHTRIKSQCALRGVKMADEIRELLEKHFPEKAELAG
jgi:predicted DNA binding CopG/RHH family protein